MPVNSQDDRAGARASEFVNNQYFSSVDLDY